MIGIVDDETGYAATFDVDKACGDLAYVLVQRRYWTAEVYLFAAASAALRVVVFWIALLSGVNWLALVSLLGVFVDACAAVSAWTVWELGLDASKWLEATAALAQLAYLALWIALYRSVSNWAWISIIFCLCLHVAFCVRAVMGLCNVTSALICYQVVYSATKATAAAIREVRKPKPAPPPGKEGDSPQPPPPERKKKAAPSRKKPETRRQLPREEIQAVRRKQPRT